MSAVGIEGVVKSGSKSARAMMQNGNMWRIIALSIVPGVILVFQNSFNLSSSSQVSKQIQIFFINDMNKFKPHHNDITQYSTH
jgi:hypothetical protein